MEKQLVETRIKTLLQKVFPEPIKTLTVSNGSKDGDNWVGNLLTVQLETVSGRKEILIIKALLPFSQSTIPTKTPEEEGSFAQSATIIEAFATELSYYTRIRPAIEKHYDQNLWLPTPKYFLGLNDIANNGKDTCLILEDVRGKGFGMADVMKGLTKPEVTLVLKKIAKFHGVTYTYLQREHQKGLLEQDPLNTHVFAKPEAFAEENYRKLFKGLYYDQLAHIKTIGAITPELHEKIIKSIPDPQKTMIESSTKAANEYFRVVIHGDVWVNNVLFKYGDQQNPNYPTDVNFIDFQQCRYASVFDDLHYFLYTSTTAEFRRNHLDECLADYYSTFLQAIKDAKDIAPPGFSKESFLEGFRKYLRYAFCYAVFAVPFHVGVRLSPEAPTPSGNEDHNEIDIENGKFSELGKDLLAGVKNSTVAISRLKDLCCELDERNVFV